MTKEIKFRLWNGYDVLYESNLSIFDRLHGNDKPEYKLMQFTGLKDTNGKDIYEGDIVEWKFPDEWCKEDGDIERHPNAGRLVWTWEVKWNTKEAKYNWPDCWYVPTVIGNIYENPELLTKE